MTTLSTGPGISQRTTTYAVQEMLAYQAAVVVLDKTGPMQTRMPKNKGINAKFRRPIPFEALTSPLLEGVTPPATQFRYEDVPATLQQYGEVVEMTDVIEDTHEDPVLNDMVRMLGENIGRTKEALAYAVLRGGTNVFYANGAARSSVNTPLSLSAQRAVVRGLTAQKAKKITRVIDGSPDYATFPIEGSWVAVGHTDLENDIRNLPGFRSVAEYGSRPSLSEYEIGNCENVRYILSPDLGSFANAGASTSTMVSTGGSVADVYPLLYFGQDAWGEVALRGMNAIEPSIIPVGTKTKDDPLAQRGYAGYKFWYTAVVLNQLWMARLECAATKL